MASTVFSRSSDILSGSLGVENSNPERKVLCSSSDFDNLPFYRTDRTLCIKGMMNQHKNRYMDVLPVDETIVNIESGYINGNYIDLGKDKKMIACQGPLENTEKDFWIMVLEHRIKVILCVTPCIEKGKVKTSKYWPSDQCMLDYEDFDVETTKVEKKGQYEISHITISSEKYGDRHLKHVYFFAWGDHDVPDKNVLLNVLIDVSECLVSEGAKVCPLVCHCSGGVGRTGVVAAILRHLETGENIRDVVASLRRQRHGMVQTKAQYRFIIDFFTDEN